MQLWIVEHFFLHKKVPVLMNHNIWKNCMLWFITYYRYLFVKKNVFNYSELHFSKLTSYKIHTLRCTKAKPGRAIEWNDENTKISQTA